MQSHTLKFQGQGLFFSHSAISQVAVRTGQVDECLEKYCTANSDHSSFTPMRSNSADFINLRPLLVVGHERNHYESLFSTPCGLLLWRTLNSITSTLSYILNKVSASQAGETFYLPIADWYPSVGRSALRNDPPGPPRALIEREGVDPKMYEQGIASHIDDKFDAFTKLNRFLHAFEAKCDMSMREFVRLANTAFAILARDSDLPLSILWASKNIAASSYLPKNGFSLIEILEAGARLWEQDMLEAQRIKDIQRWYKRSIFGIYKPVFDWILQEVQDTMLARIAIEVALLTPVDLCCSNAVPGFLYVEDTLPSWRLTRVVQAIQNSFWSNDRADQDYEMREGIAKRASITLPSDVVKATIKSRLSGEHGWGGDIKQLGIPERFTTVEYLKHLEKEIKRGLEIRSKDFVSFVRPTGQDFRPFMEFVADRAVIHRGPSYDHSTALEVLAFRYLANHYVMLALGSGGDVSLLSDIHRSFSNYWKEQGDFTEFADLWDIKFEPSLSPCICGVLKW
jgi:hypothetical protein